MFQSFSDISVSSSARNLGFIFDSDMSFTDQINPVMPRSVMMTDMLAVLHCILSLHFGYRNALLLLPTAKARTLCVYFISPVWIDNSLNTKWKIKRATGMFKIHKNNINC